MWRAEGGGCARSGGSGGGGGGRCHAGGRCGARAGALQCSGAGCFLVAFLALPREGAEEVEEVKGRQADRAGGPEANDERAGHVRRGGGEAGAGAGARRGGGHVKWVYGAMQCSTAPRYTVPYSPAARATRERHRHRHRPQHRHRRGTEPAAGDRVGAARGLRWIAARSAGCNVAPAEGLHYMRGRTARYCVLHYITLQNTPPSGNGGGADQHAMRSDRIGCEWMRFRHRHRRRRRRRQRAAPSTRVVPCTPYSTVPVQLVGAVLYICMYSMRVPNATAQPPSPRPGPLSHVIRLAEPTRPRRPPAITRTHSSLALITLTHRSR